MNAHASSPMVVDPMAESLAFSTAVFPVQVSSSFPRRNACSIPSFPPAKTIPRFL